MDPLSLYRAAIRQVLSRYADLENEGAPAAGVQTFCAFDGERDQYLVVRAGWSGQRRVKGVVLHVRLHDGKVWLEENGTDREIASELVALGVRPADIVLGFHHPSLREPSPSAVA
jgi:XisI protein